MSPLGQIVELRIAARPEAWAEAGFAVEGDRMQLGATRIRFLDPAQAPPRGAICGWSLADVGGEDFDGLETTLADPEPTAGTGAPPHPNTASTIDHVVGFTADLERTVAAFEGSGVRCRRIREPGPDAGPGPPLRQAFFRLGETLAELVELPEEKVGSAERARFWGFTVVLADLDAGVASLGERVGPITEAVQPGRRIATIRKEAGLGMPVALITPRPPKPVEAPAT